MKNRNNDYPIPDNEVDIYSVDTRIWDRMKTYLDGLGGDGGPHTHDIYADKQHEHEHNHDGDYAPDGHTHPHDHPHDHDGSYAPSGHTHDLTHTHDEFAGKEHTHDLTHEHTEYADAETLAQHLANHPSGGDGSGGSYDDTELRNRVGQNEEDIAALDAEIISTNSNVSANTEALAGKADEGHTHNTSHTHDNYIPKENPNSSYAEWLLKANGNKKNPADFAGAGHNHNDYVSGLSGTGMGLWIGTQSEYDALSNKRSTNLYVVV